MSIPRATGASKPIEVNPEEVQFEGVVQSQLYQCELQLKNTLAAPVKFDIRPSSSNKIEVKPRALQLAAYETKKVLVELFIKTPISNKVKSMKEHIFLKSDFFDQKVNVVIKPSDALHSARGRAGPPLASQVFKKPSKRSASGSVDQPLGLGGSLGAQSEAHFPITTGKWNELSRQLMEKDLTVGALQQRIGDLEGQIQSLEDDKKQGTAGSEGLQEQVRTMQSKIGDLTHELEIYRAQPQSIDRKKLIENEKKSFKVLEILKTKDAMIDSIQSKSLELENQVREGEHANRELTSLIEGQKRQIEDLTHSVQNLENSVQNSQNKACEQCEQLQQEVSGLRHKESCFTEMIERQKEQLQAYEYDMEQLKLTSNEKDEKIQSALNNLEDANTQCIDLRAYNLDLEAQNQNLIKLKEQIQTELDAKKMGEESALKQIEELKADNERLQFKLDEMEVAQQDSTQNDMTFIDQEKKGSKHRKSGRGKQRRSTSSSKNRTTHASDREYDSTQGTHPEEEQRAKEKAELVNQLKEILQILGRDFQHSEGTTLIPNLVGSIRQGIGSMIQSFTDLEIERQRLEKSIRANVKRTFSKKVQTEGEAPAMQMDKSEQLRTSDLVDSQIQKSEVQESQAPPTLENLLFSQGVKESQQPPLKVQTLEGWLDMLRRPDSGYSLESIALAGVESHTNHLLTLASQHQSQAQQIEHLKTTQNECRHKLDQKSAMADSMKDQIDQYLTKSKEQKKKLKSEVQAKMDEVKALSQQLGETQAIVAERDAQVSVMMETIESIQVEDDLQQKYLNQAAEFCSTQAQKAYQDKKVKLLESQVQELGKELKESQKSLTKLSTQKEVDEIEFKHLAAEVDSLNSEVTKIEFGKIQFEQKAREATLQKARLEQEIEGQHQEIQKLRGQLQEQADQFNSDLHQERYKLNNKLIENLGAVEKTGEDQSVQQTSHNANKLNLAVDKLILLMYDYLKQVDGREGGSRDNVEQVFKELCSILNCDGQDGLESVMNRDARLLFSEKQQIDVTIQKQSNVSQGEYNKLVTQVKTLQSDLDQAQSRIGKFKQFNGQTLKEMVKCITEELEQSRESLKVSNKALLSKEIDLAKALHENKLLGSQCYKLEQQMKMNIEQELKELEVEEQQFDATLQTTSLRQSRLVGADVEREVTALKLNEQKLVGQLCLKEEQVVKAKELNESFKHIIKEMGAKIEEYEQEASQKREGSLKEMQTDHVEHIEALLSRKSGTPTVGELKSNLDKLRQVAFEREQQIIMQKEQLLIGEQKLEMSEAQVHKLESMVAQFSQNEYKTVEDGLNEASHFGLGKDSLNQHQNSMLLHTSHNQSIYEKGDESIEDLQRKIIELKIEHLQELENLTVERDLEIADAKKQLEEEFYQLKKMYKPGDAPGDLKQTNDHLSKQVKDLEYANEHALKENSDLRHQVAKLEETNQGMQTQIEINTKVLSEIDSIPIHSALDESQISIFTTSKRDKKARKRVKESPIVQPTRGIFKSKEFIVQPSALVQLIIQSKLAEAHALSGGTPPCSQCTGQQNKTGEQTSEVGALVDAVVYLSHLVGEYEMDRAAPSPSGSIEIAQRLALRAMAKTLSRIIGNNEVEVQGISNIVPSEEGDRAVWYLELLESQVEVAAKTLRSLDEYTKRVSIDIQGSLTSAAQIKAASLELASNTKVTAEEVGQLRNICSLIKYDLNQMGTPQLTSTLDRGSVAPLNDHSQASSVELIKSKLEISERVKKSLEEELMRSKQAYGAKCEELQEYCATLGEEKGVLEQKHEDLLQEMSSLENGKEEAAVELNRLIEENTRLRDLNEQAQNDLEQAKEVMNKSQSQKSSQSKELNELTMANNSRLREKDRQITDLQNRIKQSEADIELLRLKNSKLKNQMPQDLHNSSTMKALQAENKRLAKQLQSEIHERSMQESQMESRRSSFGVNSEIHSTEKLNECQQQIDMLQKEVQEQSQDRQIINSLKIKEQKLTKSNLKVKKKVKKLESMVGKKNSMLEDVIADRDDLLKKVQATTDVEVLKAQHETQLLALRRELEMDLEKAKLSITEDASRAADAWKVKVQGLENDLKVVSDMCDKYRGQLRDKQEIICELEVEVDRCKTNAQAEAQAHQEDREARIELEQMVDGLQAQLEMSEKDKVDSSNALMEKIEQIKMSNEAIVEQYKQQAPLKQSSSKPSKTKQKAKSKGSALKNSTKHNQMAATRDGESEEQLDYSDLAEQVKKLAMVESELIMSQNENVYLTSQLRKEQEQKAQLMQTIEQLEDKQQMVKSSKSALKKDLSEANKQLKGEITGLKQEVQHLKQTWHSPKEMKEKKGREKDLESQIKLLKDELSRKKELIQNLREQREQSEMEASRVIQEMDQTKSAQDKMAKLMKENNRKDQSIRELRAGNEQARTTIRSLEAENGKLSDKVKQLKADVGRKEQLLKDAREKVDIVQKEYSHKREKMEEIDRLKEMVKRYKNDIERKDAQIKTLRSKTEEEQEKADLFKSQLTNDSLTTKQELLRESKRVQAMQNRAKQSGEAAQTTAVVLRSLIRELTTSVEKLRAKRESKGGKRKEATPDMYQESMDILGVSLNELQEFVEPGSCGPGLFTHDLQQNLNQDLQEFMERVDRIVEEPNLIAVESDSIMNFYSSLLQEKSTLESQLDPQGYHSKDAPTYSSLSSLKQGIENNNQYMNAIDRELGSMSSASGR